MTSLQNTRWIVLIIAAIMTIILSSLLIVNKIKISSDLYLWMAIMLSFLVGSILIYLAIYSMTSKKPETKPIDFSEALKKIIRKMIEQGIRIDAKIDQYGNLYNIPDYDILTSVNGYVYWRFYDNDPKFGMVKRNIFFDVKNDSLTTDIKADELNTIPSIAISKAAEIVKMIKGEKEEAPVSTPETAPKSL